MVGQDRRHSWWYAGSREEENRAEVGPVGVEWAEVGPAEAGLLTGLVLALAVPGVVVVGAVTLDLLEVGEALEEKEIRLGTKARLGE